MSTISQANYDAKKYTICAPFCGSRGLLFRQFADRFLTDVAISDQDADNSPENSGGEESLSTAPPMAMLVTATSEEAGPSQHQQAGPSQLPAINDRFELLRQILMGNESDNESD